MRFSNMRRRTLAALAIFGGTALGLGRASAQETVPCIVSSTAGTVQNREPNYWANAERVEFVFLATMRAMGDDIALYADELGGEVQEGVAAIKGILALQPDGSFAMETLQVQWPFTVARIEGQLYNLVELAYEQNAPIGIVLSAGGNSLGEIVFEKGQYDPTQPLLSFDKDVAGVIHAGLLRNEGFSVWLVSGGVNYSEIYVDTAKYTALVGETLPGAMDEAKRQDAETPCRYVDPETYGEYLDGLEDCFLTSACCTVIGLSDDCWELATLRRFRDGYMQGFAQGRADVDRYYAEAPAIAQRLVSSRAGHRELLGLYWKRILPAVLLARIGWNSAAYAVYRGMMMGLMAR